MIFASPLPLLSCPQPLHSPKFSKYREMVGLDISRLFSLSLQSTGCYLVKTRIPQRILLSNLDLSHIGNSGNDNSPFCPQMPDSFVSSTAKIFPLKEFLPKTNLPVFSLPLTPCHLEHTEKFQKVGGDLAIFRWRDLTHCLILAISLVTPNPVGINGQSEILQTHPISGLSWAHPAGGRVYCSTISR